MHRPSNQKTIGHLQVPSGVILLGDPMLSCNLVRIKGVPQGQFPVQAHLLGYVEGGQRIAKVSLTFRPEPPEKRKVVGTIGVDSATVMAVDSRVYKRHWRDVGPERIGYIGIPQHRKIARLIEKKFGLKSRQVSLAASEFEESISTDLEARIIEYLQTFLSMPRPY